ncbi:MAG: hypothetical protein M3252_07310 [Actinomycetota bacterium]|nr:hypothetical protein [Actinomycetota bacterium]
MSDVAHANQLPVEQEIRCDLRRHGPGAVVTGPVAALGLTAASQAALVAEWVVRFAGLVGFASEAEPHQPEAGTKR